MKLSDVNQFLQRKLPEPLVNIRFKIAASINFEKFYTQFFPNFSFVENQCCIFPGHDDSSPSFRAKEDGSYKCYGCNKSGSNVIQFWMHVNAIEDFKVGCDYVYRKYVINEIDLKVIEAYQENLKKDQETLRFLEISRGWNFKVIEHLKIGLAVKDDVKLITIPVYDEYGYCITILYYNFLHNEAKPKFVYEKDRDNSSQIYGREVLATSKKIYIMEGQPDWILALSLGLPAITLGSASVWRDSYAKTLKDYDIVVCYDSDDAGEEGARVLCNQLAVHARSIKSIRLPKKDFTEYLHGSGFSLEPFKQLELASEYFKVKVSSPVELSGVKGEEAEVSTLTKAAFAENYNKRLRLIALVSGKEPSPFLIPKQLQMICQDKQTATKCASCALAKTGSYSEIFTIEPTMKDILSWIVASSRDNNLVYRKTLRVNTKCAVDLRVLAMWNVEKIILNNPVAHGKFNDLPERRLAFYFGNGLVPNRHYTFEMYTTQHPTDNSVVHVVISAEPLDTEIETYQAKSEDLKHLKAFQTENIGDKLEELYLIISRNITRIWGRPLLHQALDLPFFAPNEFTFAGEFVRRASLDVMIFGDQRCGKGRVAEGLSGYSKFGEVLSGENTSFMNLIGGIETNDTFRGLKWGRIVANNGGVIIIDEASALQTEVIAKLSRVRSEGLAELDKYGIHAKALARASIIWLSNTRGEPLSKYNFGVEALKELIGQPEDIARFDYVVAVRANEVDPDIINQAVNRMDDLYGEHLHRMLILWCKTRKADQVVFTKEAVERIYEAAKILGSTYSPDIPLLQVENARIKLAKVAAAIAGRVFSCSADYMKLVIDVEHVNFALEFYNKIYSEANLGYLAYSKMTKISEKLDATIVDNILSPLAKVNMLQGFLHALLTMNDITIFDINDATGFNSYETRVILGNLVREGALQKNGKYYRKSSAFIDYIKNKIRLAKEAP